MVSKIIGIRILIQATELNGDYYVKYEFTNTNWKLDAIHILPYFIGRPNIKIQTLHQLSPSYTGYILEPSNIWIDNYQFNLKDLTI